MFFLAGDNKPDLKNKGKHEHSKLIFFGSVTLTFDQVTFTPTF